MKTQFLWATITAVGTFSACSAAFAGPYAPGAGMPGTTAIPASDPRFVGWATGFTNLIRGPIDIENPSSPLASFGTGNSALGQPNAVGLDGQPSQGSASVVSLGDGGSITLTLSVPITNGPGPDFAVFENGFDNSFLELAFVEVSSDGQNFIRFPAYSLTQTEVQIDQANENFSRLDPTDIDGFAGKYRAGFGVPFDLETVAGTMNLNVLRVTHVRIVDVVGSINPDFARRDSSLPVGRIINDPWPTPFASGGFDLDALGVINAVPEPSAALLAATASLAFFRRRRR